MVLSRNTYCEDITSDHLLYVDIDSHHNTNEPVKYYDVDPDTFHNGPYVKTGMKEYNHSLNYYRVSKKN